MAEEIPQEDLETTRVGLTMSKYLKLQLEEEAKKYGIPITQYIMNLIVNDMKNIKK